MNNFNEKLEAWIKAAQDVINSTRVNTEYGASRLVSLIQQPGRKYIRIVAHREEGGQTVESYAYAFIEAATGNVLKPDGWKTPARHSRGCIFDEKGGLGWVTPYGIESIRR